PFARRRPAGRLAGVGAADAESAARRHRRPQHGLRRRRRRSGPARSRARRPGAAPRQPNLHAADRGFAREPGLRLRLHPDGAAMTTTTRALWTALVASAAVLAARPCLASGFLIYDISGQAIARASAVSADDDEPA